MVEKKASELTREERLYLLDCGLAEPGIAGKPSGRAVRADRSSLYYRPVALSAEELSLKNRIDELYTKYPFYGSRRITAALRRQGFTVNRKATQRHMREMGIAGICPGPNLSKRNSEHRVYPYLLRGLKVAHPNHVWGIDITYIRLQHGWMYLVALIDWYSRYVVSWELDQSLGIPFVLTAVGYGLEKAKPRIMNSDQGSEFTSCCQSAVYTAFA